MVLGGLTLLVACIVLGRRLTPPAREAPARLLAGLATASLVAFGLAALGLGRASAPLAGLGLAATGACAGAYLWLLRGGEDDGWPDDPAAPGPDDPRLAEWRRFRRTTPRRPRVSRRR